MFKRCSGILLSLVLILSLTFTVFGEVVVESGSSVNPNDYSYTLTVTATDTEAEEAAADSMISYQWYECDSAGQNPKIIQGAAGPTYKPPVSEETRYFYCLVTKTTYEGSESTRSSILTVVDKTPVKVTKVMTISVKDINEPVTDESPDTTATPVSNSDETAYSISSVSWNPSNSKFQPETVYTVTVNVSLAENFEAGDGLKCLINGQEALITGDPTTGKFGFSYTFDKTEAANPGDEADNPGDLENEKEKSPSPLGIPGWIWAAIIIILILAVIAALIAAKRFKSKNTGAGRRRKIRDDDDDDYEEDDDDDSLNVVRRTSSKRESSHIEELIRKDSDPLNEYYKPSNNQNRERVNPQKQKNLFASNRMKSLEQEYEDAKRRNEKYSGPGADGKTREISIPPKSPKQRPKARPINDDDDDNNISYYDPNQ